MSNKKVDERDELKKKSARKDIENEIEEEEPAEGGSNPEDTERGPQNEDQEPGNPEPEGQAKELDEALQARYLRLVADFQNLKRRTEKEKADIYAFANEKIAVDLLNVIDNFERAMDHIQDSSDKTLAEGMGMIYKLLKEVFEKNGINEIKTQGEDFDPNFHHAVMTVSTDDYEGGKVVEAMQKGYTLKGKVIRPAMVKVAE